MNTWRAGPAGHGRGDQLERALRLHRLYDQYGGLLTTRQRDVFEYYHWHDLSLGEIAGHLGISRQAVYDLLRRGEAILEQAETALGVVAWRRRARRRVRRLAALIRAAEEELKAVPAGVPPDPGPAAGCGTVPRPSRPPHPPAGKDGGWEAAGSPEAVRRARRLLAGARRVVGWMLQDLEGGGQDGLREPG